VVRRGFPYLNRTPKPCIRQVYIYPALSWNRRHTLSLPLASRRPRVFVTDGSYPNSLAIVRTLARHGAEVIVGEGDHLSPRACVAYWSRYCSKRVTYPHPIPPYGNTVAMLKDFFSHERIDAFIPVSLQMVELAVHNAATLGVPMMVPTVAAFELAADKKKTFAFANEIGIPIPLSVPARQYATMQPPCVFKHPRTGVLIANDAAEMQTIATRLDQDLDEYLVQEYIPGQNGYGYFGFFVDGQEVGYFMHERLMQYPTEGGPSVVARSFYDEDLREYGKRLLMALRWHGVAMVEFKKSSRDGTYYLMEINPKYWGSLDLAIYAGCNFPLWMQQYVLGGKPEIPASYRLDAVFHWVVPRGLKCLIRYPGYRLTFLRNLFRANVSSEVWLRDPMPSVAGVIAASGNAFRL
jgi:predicted ATP-grasp superfamily ATP-dependent carboligase